jgi:hypothetical protein
MNHLTFGVKVNHFQLKVNMDFKSHVCLMLSVHLKDVTDGDDQEFFRKYYKDFDLNTPNNEMEILKKYIGIWFGECPVCDSDVGGDGICKYCDLEKENKRLREELRKLKPKEPEIPEISVADDQKEEEN